MKSLFALVFCLGVIPAIPSAQNAHFPLENARWCYNRYGDLGTYEGMYCVGPDSLLTLSGKTYARVIAEQTYLYREEAGKLYVIPQDSTQEYVVYDFNLNLGDTFQVKWGGIQEGANPYKVVYYVDTIITADGIARRRLQMGNENGDISWVEGIGAEGTYGFYWHFLNPVYYAGVSGAYSLACVAFDSMPVYPDASGIAACLPAAAGEVNKLPLEVALFPNPAGAELFAKFSLDRSRRLDFCLYNVLGMPVWRQAASLYPAGEHTLRIDTGELPAGIYVLRLENEGRVTALSVAIDP